MSEAFSNNENCFNIANSFNHIVADDESKILAWLSPLEPWVRQRDIGSQRVDCIGGWLLETKEFRCWHNSSKEGESAHATLFCDGNPGVGKSYITSLVIDKLCDEAEEENTAVTCFYFDFAARTEQSPVNMLGSLLRQLVGGPEKIPEGVVQSFRKHQRVIGGRRLQVSEILNMFQTIASTKRTFICVDALDECVPEHRMVVLESLGQILQESPNTRIFMTGRPPVWSDVERKLGAVATFISIRATEDGLKRYLHERLRNDTAPEMMSGTLEADIMKSIPETSSETFLLASLHIGAILRETTIARREKRLKSVGDWTGLGDAYGVTLERIKAQDVEKTRLAIATLTWICHAERPLQVDELCHALAVEIGAKEFNTENVPSIGTLLGYCQGLITVDREASTVRLIHFTAQEYLRACPDLFNKPHSIIAETCLTYLNSRQVKNLSSRPLPDHQGMPFLKYSSSYWGTHANKELSENGMTLALELLHKYEGHVSATSLLKQVLSARCIGDIGTPLFSGLHYASYFGIVELVTVLINVKGCDINQQDSEGRTPLLWAAEKGHEEAAKALLEREDVDANLPDKHGRSALWCAAFEGHEGVVKLLLGRVDVGPDRPNKYGQTPLWCAAVNGHGGVVKLLLKRGDVDPNRPNENNRTPLWSAARNRHEGVLKLLLEQEGVDPNCPDKYDQTPLWCAAADGNERVVKLLLQRGDVDPNHADEHNRTPLWCAVKGGHEGVVKLLLELENVDPNRPDNYDQSPLWCAAAQGQEGVVKILLERGDVDPNRPNDNTRTPLWSAASNRHEIAVKLLLEQESVDPNCPDKYDQTPLWCAAADGNERFVKLLLQRGDVDPNHADEHKRTPLWCAVKGGHEGVVKLLLERENVDPNHPDKHDQSPLWCAAAQGQEGVVRILLKRGDVDPNRSNANGRTPLQSAARNRHEGVVKLLLGRGDVNPNRPDENY